MSRLAVRGASRRLLVKLHRWSGLAILAFLTVAALTGSYLAFRSEFDRWLNPTWMTVQSTGPRLPMQTIIANVEARFPDATVGTIYPPDEVRETFSVYLKPKTAAGVSHHHGAAMASGIDFDQVFVDPHTGDLLGQRDTSKNTITRANLGHFMLRLHYKLLAGDLGGWILGICAVVWLLTAIIGMVLSWPGAWRLVTSWKPIVSVRIRGGSYKFNYDLHRSPSVVLLPAWIVLAFSSVYLNLPGLVRPAVNAISPLTVTPAAPQDHGSGPFTVSADQAVVTALDAVPEASVYSVTKDLGKGWYSVRLHRPDDPSPLGNNYAYVDGYTGAVSARTLARAASAGDRFIFWQFPLHSGLAFGLVGQSVIAALGLIFAISGVSSVYIWWIGYGLRRRDRARRRVPWRAERASRGRVATAAIGMSLSELEQKR